MSRDKQRLRGSRVVVVDVETTGFGHADQIVEIALVSIDPLFGPGCAPVVELCTLVNPGIPIPSHVTKVHGITDRDVRQAPSWERVWERVGETLTDASVVLCAHNASFDRRFIARGQDGVPDAKLWLDTQAACRRLETHGKESLKLEGACRARGIQPGTHRASSDALATGLLLLALIREAYALPANCRPPERPSVREWLDWQQNLPPTLRFA